MKKIWVKKFKSFREENEADLKHYLAMDPEKRLDIIQLLCEMHMRAFGDGQDESRKRLRRSIRIIKQK